MADATGVQAVHDAMRDDGAHDELDPDATGNYPVPNGVEVYEINGPFFFGAAAAFTDTIARVAGKPKMLILRMRRVPLVDATGLLALGDVVRRSRKDGSLVLLAELPAAPLETLRRSAVFAEIGAESLYPR